MSWDVPVTRPAFRKIVTNSSGSAMRGSGGMAALPHSRVTRAPTDGAAYTFETGQHRQVGLRASLARALARQGRVRAYRMSCNELVLPR